MTNLATVPLPQDESLNHGATMTQDGDDWYPQVYYKTKKSASIISVVDPLVDQVDDQYSLSSIPPYEEVDEEPSEGFRGVFPVNKKRKVIATFQVKFKLSELKRRKPTVILEGPQSLREDD
ncbi:MAG: hypothetical protein KC964_12440 [Candidatus Omnitrophica bacterium]|nr:hypothetical protein [Candidatus Omnitrophota bacterium]MCB9767477.1 hypothetical protein [Candidatus Omnitrophota bacterium]